MSPRLNSPSCITLQQSFCLVLFFSIPPLGLTTLREREKKMQKCAQTPFPSFLAIMAIFGSFFLLKSPVNSPITWTVEPSRGIFFDRKSRNVWEKERNEGCNNDNFFPPPDLILKREG